tara:strand:+ start:13668 stop:14621 length:954 start_codon:yes stop_codon:yes gene_type:complete
VSNLLINEPPLQVLPSLARVIGLNEAIMLQQVHYWLHHARVKHDGRMWIYKTFEQWHDQDFSFWSLSTIKRISKNLISMNLLLVEKLANNSFDRVNHYTVNYEKLAELVVNKPKSTVTTDSVNVTQSNGANCPQHSVNVTQSDSVNMHQCLRDNKETNKENIYTNDSQNEDVISVMNKNAQSILDWQAPSKNEMQAELIRAGSTLQMTDDQYQIYVGDFKAHFEQNALKGNPLLGDRNRKNRLRQWLENIAKKQPKQSNVFQGNTNANHQPANNQHQQYDTSTTAGYAAKLDADAAAYYAEQARAQQSIDGSTENAF